MFATVPVYAADLTSQERMFNPTHIEEVRPNPNVPVDPGAVDTESCWVQFFSGQERIVLLPYATMKQHLQSITGIVDDYGTLI